jgi:hypothetical protein
MLQEDQNIAVNYCDVVSASHPGIQGDPSLAALLTLRHEVVILGSWNRTSRAPFDHAKPDTVVSAAREGYIVAAIMDGLGLVVASSAPERVVGGWGPKKLHAIQ